MQVWILTVTPSNDELVKLSKLRVAPSSRWTQVRKQRRAWKELRVHAIGTCYRSYNPIEPL